MRGHNRLVCSVVCVVLCAAATVARADEADAVRSERAGLRELASRRIDQRSDAFDATHRNVKVQLLAFNDFHGQLTAGKVVDGRPAGSAPVLAAYLAAARAEFPGTTFIVHAGDHVGASPPTSALLQDEPSMAFLNLLDKRCKVKAPKQSGCELIGTLGNHEFDEGVDELLRLIKGGAHARGPFLDKRYRGATFPYVCANVVDAKTSEPILPPYVVRKVGNIPIGFIGAVLTETPTIVMHSGVARVKFLDEADAINAQVAALRKLKVEAIVVLIHQGGSQTAFAGSAPPIAIGPGGAIAEIVRRLDSAVDVVVSGHAHAFTNAFLHNAAGQSILVTQAFSAGTAYADIELTLDPESSDVVERSSAVITTFADAGPGLHPDRETDALVKTAELKVRPLVTRPVGVAARALTRETSRAGESALGNLVADAQRHAMQTDFAFMNPGGLRADLPAGPITWGALFTVQPFGNTLIRLELTGAEIRELLEQQWLNQPLPRVMQISGLGYTWNSEAPTGRRVVEVHTEDGKPLDPAATYSVAVSSFLAEGGDNFSVFMQGRNRSAGPLDLEAFNTYLRAQPQPFNSSIQNRIRVTRWEKP